MIAMNSAQDAANFLRKLGQLLLVFDAGDPDPLKYLQNRRLNTWKALLNGSTVAKSRTQKHVQRNARQFASKVTTIASHETLYLCMIEYSVSGLPKIVYGGFYRALEGWSQSAQFPELLTEQTSKFWDGSNLIRGGVGGPEEQYVSRNGSAEQIISNETVPLIDNRHVTPRSDEESDDNPVQTMSNSRSQNATRLREYPEEDSIPSSTNMYNRNESHLETRKPLEMAFLVPPNLLDFFYQLHKDSTDSQQHSAILTVPTQDHVASLILSIPRTEAALEGDKHNLPVIFNSRDSSA